MEKSPSPSLQPRNAALPQFVDLRGHAIDAILLRHADPEPLHATRERRLIVRHGHID
jgi:hypothetical protein